MGRIGKVGREVVKNLDYQHTSKNQTKRFDFDNPSSFLNYTVVGRCSRIPHVFVLSSYNIWSFDVSQCCRKRSVTFLEDITEKTRERWKLRKGVSGGSGNRLKIPTLKDSESVCCP